MMHAINMQKLSKIPFDITEVGPVVHDSDKTVSDDAACSAIGDEVLSLGGNAVDAAVAATFCLAVVNPHITGIGGGGVMIIHMHRSNETVVIDFRETAPKVATNET